MFVTAGETRSSTTGAAVSTDGNRTSRRAPPSGDSSARDRAAHRVDELVDDRQPEPGADLGPHRRRARCVQPLEHVVALVGRDARPVVVDAHQPAAVVAGDRHVDAAAGELGRVRQQVAEHLLDPLGVGERRRRGAGRAHGEGEPGGLGGGEERPHGVVDGHREIMGHRVQRERPTVEAGQREEVGDEPIEPFGLGRDDRRGGGRIGCRAVADGLGVAADGRQRRAQVVADREQELLVEGARPLERWRPSC